MLIKEVTLGLLSALWVQRTQEKDSLQSKGIHANWPLWSLRKPGASPSSCGYIGERCVVVRAVEILDLAGTDQSVLD